MDWVGLLLNFGRWEGLMKIRVHQGAEVGGRGEVRWRELQAPLLPGLRTRNWDRETPKD